MAGIIQDSEHTSSSPENEWEEWMDWDAKPKVQDGQPTPPSEVTAENSKRSSLDDNRSSNHLSSSKISKRESRLPKKRKVANDTARSPKNPGVSKSNLSQNRSHSLVEKRYRTNLNGKIADLRKSIPSLREESQSASDPQILTSAAKINKATILVKAIEYIRQLEARNSFLEDTNDALRRRACDAAEEEEYQAESAPKREPISPKGTKRKSSPAIETLAIDAEPPRGMIHVPEEIRRLREVTPQQHYADDARFSNEAEDSAIGNTSISTGRMLGRLVAGSLTGLMAIDRIAGNSSQDRGLFALPFVDFKSTSTLSKLFQPPLEPHLYVVLLPLVKGFLVFSLLGMLLFLYLFTSKPKFSKPLSNATQTQRVQYSNSPMVIRRNAWLTSIQTVWVPSHNILPEMWALIRETHAYTIRSLLGWRSYSWLTGRSEEEETARVRAWEIALDAQLTGGDQDLSKGRLVLTLWAAGTLPKAPARVMLKALHIRVMFWEASSSASICRMLNSVADSLAYYQWFCAQKMLNAMEKQANCAEMDLPSHLSVLLRSPFEEVMTDDNVHRLHNLAWNRHPATATEEDTDLNYLFDEDTAMRGPLDILAIWCSGLKLQHALGKFVQTGDNSPNCISQIGAALHTAPPGSSSSIRALAAKAVLSVTDLVTDMARLLEALPLLKANTLPTSLADLDSLPKAVQNNVMIAIRCAEALIMILGAEHDPGSVSKALQVLASALPEAESLDLLGFAAVIRLLHVLLNSNCLESYDRSGLCEAMRSAIKRLRDAPGHLAISNTRQRDYVTALEKLLPQQNLDSKRRQSTVSIDSGYWSFYDERKTV